MAGRAPGPKHAVEVGLAVELAPLGEAAVLQDDGADGAAEAGLVKVQVAAPHHKLVPDGQVTLGALSHGSSGFVLHGDGQGRGVPIHGKAKDPVG